MAFSRFRSARKETDVNLIPVMNLFVTLIPFMLLGAASYMVAVIPTSFPSQTDQTSDVATDPKSVTVNLIVARDYLELSASNPSLSEEVMAELELTIARGAQGFDLGLLTRGLAEIKRRFENSDTVIVLPADDVLYHDLIRILDATRELVTDRDSAKERRLPLFPVVVLSRKV